MPISSGVKLPAARRSGESASTNSKRWLPSFTLEARLCILFRYRAKELAVSPPKFFVLVNTTHWVLMHYMRSAMSFHAPIQWAPPASLCDERRQLGQFTQ
jgi:hypothetical protein